MSEQDFDPFALHYDLEYGAFADDVPFYRGFASRTGGPLIEYGCGTGRLLLALAEKGYDITGVDVSPAMLERARQSLDAHKGLAARVHLVQADARTVELGERFAFSFWAINSFMHLTTQADQLRALAQARRHLATGGLLALDLFNPEPALLLDADAKLVHDGLWPAGDGGRLVARSSSRRLNLAEQRLDVTYFYDEIAMDGQVRRMVAPFTMRYLHRFEAQLLLERAGFVVEALYGSYDLDEYSADSPRLIFIARKGSE